MAVQTQIQTRRGTAASWTSTNPTLAAGEIGFETDTGKFKIGNGSTAWASLAYSAGATAVTYLFNATGGQTTFTGTDANGLTLAYTVGAEQVYLNGVLQVRGSDYTATDGTSIVLASGALVSDVLNVIAYSAMTITDTYTQAQADAKFFQTANSFLAGKNKIINGDFGVWQRGTSITIGVGAFWADRYSMDMVAAVPTGTASRQAFTPGAAPVAGYEGNFFGRVNITAHNNSTQYYISQRIENVTTFAGQTITLSAFMKADAATSIGANLVQNFGSGGSGAVVTSISPSTNITSGWVRYTWTVTVPSISGKTIGTGSSLEIRFNIPTTGGFVRVGTYDFWGVQLEAGSIATPFSTATGTIQGELAACQRYYYRQGGSTVYEPIGGGYGATTTAGEILLQLPVTLRTFPSSLDFSTLVLYDNTTLTPVTNVLFGNNGIGKNCCRLQVFVASGLTQFRPYELLTNNSTAGYLGVSAEL